MAKVNKNVRKIPKTIEVEEEYFTLELTPDEVQVLRDIVGWGITGGGRRALTNGIFSALNNAGIHLSKKIDFKGTIDFGEETV